MRMSVKLTMEGVKRHVRTVKAHTSAPAEWEQLWLMMACLVKVIFNAYILQVIMQFITAALPLSLVLINSSPRISSSGTAIEFLPSKPLRSASCTILRSTSVDCKGHDNGYIIGRSWATIFQKFGCILYWFHLIAGSSGEARFPSLTPGYHRLRIIARATTGERYVLRRAIFICMGISQRPRVEWELICMELLDWTVTTVVRTVMK